ncbi:MAG: hypothetical protein QG639_419 [Patescibacteria group bacterium]|nr:hypothetical protein [Patescibacteria group bacterium]
MTFFQVMLSSNPGAIANFQQIDILSGIFKVLFLLSVFFYVIFAVIVIRQVQIMKNTLITPVSPVILLASILHLLVAVGILFLFFFIL